MSSEPGQGTGRIRWIDPRHADYWESVSGGSGDEPCYLEFVCRESPVPSADADGAFFRLDLGNLTAAKAWCLDDEGWKDFGPDRQSAFVRLTGELEAGKTDFFIDWLYYRDDYPDHAVEYLNPLPEGRTVAECRNRNGVSPDYAVLFVRENRRLLPEVLCEWMERLSPVLFGDRCVYRMAE